MWLKVSICLVLLCAPLIVDAIARILCKPGLAAQKFTPQNARLEDIPSSESNDCSAKRLGLLCRQHYPNVLGLQEYKKSMRGVIGKCQRYHPAKQLKAPKGGWSDRLVAMPQSDCFTENEWLGYAAEECGKKPKLRSVGEQCDKSEKKYRDFVFVCDRSALNDTVIVPPLETQLIDLARYVDLAQQLKAALTNGEDGQSHELRENLVNLTKSIKQEGFDFKTSKDIAMEFTRSNLKVQFDIFVSRNVVFDLWKQCAVHAGLQRSYKLINFALAIMSNDSTTAELRKGLIDYGLDTVSCDSVPIYLFPELEPHMEKFWLYHIQQETPGFNVSQLAFLALADGHEKLVSMYESVFDPTLLNKAVSKRTFFSALSSAVLTLGLVTVCASVAVYACSRRIKQYHIGDHSVIYNRFNNAPIDDKDITVDMDAVPDDTVTA